MNLGTWSLHEMLEYHNWAPDASSANLSSHATVRLEEKQSNRLGDHSLQSCQFRDSAFHRTFSMVIWMALCLLQFLIGRTDCQKLIRQGLITANITTGIPTSLVSDIADVPLFRLSSPSDPTPLFGYTTQTHSPCPLGGQPTKFFRLDGTVVFTAGCGTGTLATAIVLKSDDTLFLFYYETDTGNSAKSVVYTLSYSSGLYSINDDKKMELSLPNIGSAIGEDNKDYVYYFTEDNMVARYDQDPPSGPQDPDPSSDIGCPSPRSVYFHPTSTSNIVHYGMCGVTPKIQFILKTDLTVSKTLTAAGGEGAYMHTLNNLDAGQMYVGASAKVMVYDIASS